MPLIALAILIVLAFIAVIPLSIIQRFRMGTARRTARKWVATLNLAVVALSVLLFLAGTLVTSRWIPEALAYTAYGLAGGCLLGVIGLALTRWDYVGGRINYTPNRWLVLAITLLVTARVLYGFWRGWEAWRTGLESAAWVTASGIAGSMSAGAVVLGYYLIFWAGVRRRVRRHERI
jgi:hypothetical protein